MTTSGTAVANLHPAVLEAVHVGRAAASCSSADRPAALRGTGANQTTDQVAHLRSARAAAPTSRRATPAAVGRAIARRPLGAARRSVNLQFAEPLLPEPLPRRLPGRRRCAQVDRAAIARSSRAGRRPSSLAARPADGRRRRRRRRAAGAAARPGRPTGRCSPSRRPGSRTGTHALRDVPAAARL